MSGPKIKPAKRSVEKAVDTVQKQITDYADVLTYEGLSPEAIHAAKVRVIDTLGTVIGGFFGEPPRIARELASQIPDPNGGTILGTRIKTTIDMAAFANATAARDVEMSDTYHWPNSAHGHPSDVITPLLAVAEQSRASGRDFITSVVLAYEVYLRFSTVFHNIKAFDHTNFAVISIAAAASKLLGLDAVRLSHSISLAAVPNVMLRQTRRDHLSMFKSAASGHAGRAGIFAAQLARAGMDGPHLPFEGGAGWADQVARERFSLGEMGGGNVPFKILDTRIKSRPCEGNGISHILAAEKIAPFRNIDDIAEIVVEVHKHAKRETGGGDHQWIPESRETADHSAPYLVAVTLMDGTVTPRSYDDAHLWNPQLRELMKKVVVIENEEFTKAYERLPVEHRTRVTVTTKTGEKFTGEAGGDADDLSFPMADDKVEGKFRMLASGILTPKRIDAIFDRLWTLDRLSDVSVIPSDFAFV